MAYYSLLYTLSLQDHFLFIDDGNAKEITFCRSKKRHSKEAATQMRLLQVECGDL